MHAGGPGPVNMIALKEVFLVSEMFISVGGLVVLRFLMKHGIYAYFDRVLLSPTSGRAIPGRFHWPMQLRL